MSFTSSTPPPTASDGTPASDGAIMSHFGGQGKTVLPPIVIHQASPSASLLPSDAPWASSEVTAYRSLLAVNSISILACVMVLAGYWMMQRWHPRIMRRLSLRLVACMAGTELILHITNLVGYGKLPTEGFLCGLFGGFFFAACSLTSLFYACAVALNCQLVFVFAKRPSVSKEKFFVSGPPLIALVISIPTLASGMYGYDQDLEYCWYASSNSDHTIVLAKMLATFGGWVMLGFLYLIISCTTIIRAVFSPHSSSLQISATVDGFAAPSQTVDVIARRKTAIRRLVIRLMGFIAVPSVCVLTGVILDVLVKADVRVTSALDAAFEVISGLAGTFNFFLFLFDPAVLAIKDHKWGAIEDDEMRPRPYTMSAWTTRTSEDSTNSTFKKPVDVNPAPVESGWKKFRDLEDDLRGL